MIIEKVEALEEQKSEIAGEIRDTFSEAKSIGFDVKTLRQILKLRKLDQKEVQEQEELLTVYLQAIEMASKPQPQVQAA